MDVASQSPHLFTARHITATQCDTRAAEGRRAHHSTPAPPEQNHIFKACSEQHSPALATTSSVLQAADLSLKSGTTRMKRAQQQAGQQAGIVHHSC